MIDIPRILTKRLMLKLKLDKKYKGESYVRRNERPNAGASSKMQELYDLGIDPFGGKFVRTSMATPLHDDWDQFSKEELQEKKQKVMLASLDV